MLSVSRKRSSCARVIIVGRMLGLDEMLSCWPCQRAVSLSTHGLKNEQIHYSRNRLNSNVIALY